MTFFKITQKATQATAIMLALAMVPAATSALTSMEAENHEEMMEFLRVFDRVKYSYVEEVDDETLIRGAIDGMLASLDPHSSFLDAHDYENLNTTTEGKYGGLGLSVTMDEGAVKVITPTKGTPAFKAGIKSGDYITHVNGDLIYGGTLNEAVDLMRGDPGTDVTITLVREGRDAPFDVTITRDIIRIEPVEWEVKDRIGIINVAQFSGNVSKYVANAMKSISAQLGGKPDGIILDLRSNPGGLLEEAVFMSDLFLDKGEIVSQRGRHARDTENYYAHYGDLARDVPVIVLIDSGSASASEIVAGALQDHHRALVMGERSFGKGSVQTLLEVSRTSAIKLTTARYYTPSGRSVQEGGIDPDIAVPQLSDPDYKKRLTIRESDLRRHLRNEIKQDDKELEKDTIDDPRFSATADELKEKGIEDFQLHYAIATLQRTTKATTLLAARNSKKPAAKN